MANEHRTKENDMEILEQRTQWQEQFRNGWLKHYQTTGSIDWSLYNRPDNKVAPAGEPIELESSRLLFITSSGAYLANEQVPFDVADDVGDYSIRTMPSDTPYEAIGYAHTHYDHTARIADPQVLMPLTHLAAFVDEGVIGNLTPNLVSFMGYQPDVTQLLDETIPAIIAVAKDERADGALLVPA